MSLLDTLKQRRKSQTPKELQLPPEVAEVFGPIFGRKISMADMEFALAGGPEGSPAFSLRIFVRALVDGTGARLFTDLDVEQLRTHVDPSDIALILEALGKSGSIEVPDAGDAEKN